MKRAGLEEEGDDFEGCVADGGDGAVDGVGVSLLLVGQCRSGA